MKTSEEDIEITREELEAIPDRYLAAMIAVLMGTNNETVDLLTPLVRPSLENVYPSIITVYAVLAATGTVSNSAMVSHIVRKKLYVDPTYAFLINIALCNVIMSLIVLPITLAVLLVQNWIFGKFLCYSLPILQDAPIHVAMMTFVLIAGDRYRFLSDPQQLRIPSFVFAVGSWFSAVCIVLPHPIYTTYLDLETFGKEHFRGIGICITNLTDNIQPYVRGLFLLTYIAPLTITTYIYVKASRELRTQVGPSAVGMLEARIEDSYSTSQGSSTSNDVTPRHGKRKNGTGVGTSETAGRTARPSILSHTLDIYDAELDVPKEKRTQKCLIYMVSTFAVLLCPLMVLKLAKLGMVETYANSGYFDIIFTVFVWLAFTSTVTTPSIYASWQMSRLEKDRLRAYFCCPKRQLPGTVENEIALTTFRVPDEHASLANVGYVQTMRMGNISESYRRVTNPRGSAGLQSPIVGVTKANRISSV